MNKEKSSEETTSSNIKKYQTQQKDQPKELPNQQRIQELSPDMQIRSKIDVYLIWFLAEFVSVFGIERCIRDIYWSQSNHSIIYHIHLHVLLHLQLQCHLMLFNLFKLHLYYHLMILFLLIISNMISKKKEANNTSNKICSMSLT